MPLKINELRPDQSLVLYAVTLFISYQKVPKIKIVCYCSREGDLY